MRIHINHTDLDAAGIFVINRYYNIEFDKYISLNYEDITDKKGVYVFPQKHAIGKSDDILITDLMISKEMYEDVKQNSNSYNIFDHHQSTSEYATDPNVVFDDKKSGTKIYFEWITKGKRVPANLIDFVEVVNAYDMWQTESPYWQRALNLNRLFYQIQLWDEEGIKKLDWFINSQLKKLRMTNNEFFFTDDEMKRVNKAKEKEDQVFVKAKLMMKVRRDNMNNAFGIVVLDKKISYTMFRLLEERKDLAYIIAVNSYGGITGKLHIRIQRDNNLNANNFEKFEGHGKAGGGQVEVKEAVDFFQGLTGRKFFEYKNPITKEA